MNVKAAHCLYTVLLIFKRHIKLFPSETFECNKEVDFHRKIFSFLFYFALCNFALFLYRDSSGISRWKET